MYGFGRYVKGDGGSSIVPCTFCKQVFVYCSSHSPVVPGGTQCFGPGRVFTKAGGPAHIDGSPQPGTSGDIHSPTDFDFDCTSYLYVNTAADIDATPTPDFNGDPAADFNTPTANANRHCCSGFVCQAGIAVNQSGRQHPARLFASPNVPNLAVSH